MISLHGIRSDDTWRKIPEFDRNELNWDQARARYESLDL